MRKIAPVLLVLFAFICLPCAPRAQSGRSRAGQNTNSPGMNKTDRDNSVNEEESSAPQLNVQGEEMEGDVLRVETTLVTVPVNVKDRNGRYIPDLSREDFHIFEDGVEQKITYFAAVDHPFTVALVMDTSRSTNFKLEDIQAAAIAFVNQLKSEDRVMVVSFDDRINVLTEPTNDRAELTRAIRRTRTGGGTRLYDAVDMVIKRLMQVEGRKAMVLFTDGVDTESRRATYETTLRLAEEQDALIYPVAYDTDNGFGPMGGGQQRLPLPGGRGGISIGIPFPRMPMPGGGGGIPGGGGPSSPEARRGGAYLRELAQRTGGRFYNGDTLSGISQAFALIAEELRRQYSLGYYPKTSASATQPQEQQQRRQIRVRVNQPNLVVTARDSYIYSQKRTGSTETNEQPPLAKPVSQGNQVSETQQYIQSKR
ncbi:MAG TPA: VWA domain-containing protein [Pyrinomonadaceae bacterium]|jgi:VWFA-related protein